MFRLIHFTLPLALAVLSDSVVHAAPTTSTSSSAVTCPAVSTSCSLNEVCTQQESAGCGTIKIPSKDISKYKIGSSCQTATGKYGCAQQCWANSQCQAFQVDESDGNPAQPGPGFCTLYSITASQMNLVSCVYPPGTGKHCGSSEIRIYNKNDFAYDTKGGFYLQTSSSNPDYNNLYAAKNTINNITTLGYANTLANALFFTIDPTTSTLLTNSVTMINQDADMERPDEPIYLDSQGTMPSTSFVGVTATINSVPNVLLSSGQRNVLFANADRYGNYIGLGKDSATYSDLTLTPVCPAATS